MLHNNFTATSYFVNDCFNKTKRLIKINLNIKTLFFKKFLKKSYIDIILISFKVLLFKQITPIESI